MIPVEELKSGNFMNNLRLDFAGWMSDMMACCLLIAVCVTYSITTDLFYSLGEANVFVLNTPIHRLGGWMV